MRKLALLVPLVLALALSACNSGSEHGRLDRRRRGLEGSVEASPGGGGSEASDSPVSSSAVPQVGPQVVKTASLRLGIAHGSFEDKVGEAHAVADSYAGFVVESFASQGSGKRIAEGSLVLRIPAESYDSALSRLRELGKVESLEESGQDVSKEFVDLNARIRQLRAVEAQLLELLQRADDVPARSRSRTSSPRSARPGAAPVPPPVPRQPRRVRDDLDEHPRARRRRPKDGGFKIVDAWATAGSAFLTVVGWPSSIAVAAPVLILLVLGFLVGREIRRRLAH